VRGFTRRRAGIIGTLWWLCVFEGNFQSLFLPVVFMMFHWFGLFVWLWFVIPTSFLSCIRILFWLFNSFSSNPHLTGIQGTRASTTYIKAANYWSSSIHWSICWRYRWYLKGFLLSRTRHMGYDYCIFKPNDAGIYIIWLHNPDKYTHKLILDIQFASGINNVDE
jgi:hypothetical protein